MNDVTEMNGGGAGLPSNFLQKMAAGIAQSRATTVLGVGGKPLLRLSRAGDWIFGQNNEPVQDGSQWAVNVATLAHGYVKWVDSEKVGESLTSMAEAKPARPGEGYQELRSCELKCLDGDDAGTEVRYNTNSYGGLNAFDGLLVTMQNHWSIDPAHPCPVLELSSKDYDHKKYGQTFNPIFTVVGWVDMNGSFADDAEVKPTAPSAKAEPVKPEKPRKPSLKAAASEVPKGMHLFTDANGPEAGPQPTQRAHAGQRRRPTAG